MDKDNLIELIENSYNNHFNSIYSSLKAIEYNLSKIKKDDELRDLNRLINKNLLELKNKVNSLTS